MELTDLEICKRIAEIEGFEFRVGSLTSVTPVGVWPKVPFKDVGMSLGSSSYNPLTDDALCFRLMVKYEVGVDTYTDTAYILSDYTNRTHKAVISIDDDINKAICLAIIEAHNER
jgi:hypothetical protein